MRYGTLRIVASLGVGQLRLRRGDKSPRVAGAEKLGSERNGLCRRPTHRIIGIGKARREDLFDGHGKRRVQLRLRRLVAQLPE